MLSVRVPPTELNISAFPPVLRNWVIKDLGMSSLVYATGQDNVSTVDFVDFISHYFLRFLPHFPERTSAQCGINLKEAQLWRILRVSRGSLKPAGLRHMLSS